MNKVAVVPQFLTTDNRITPLPTGFLDELWSSHVSHEIRSFLLNSLLSFNDVTLTPEQHKKQYQNQLPPPTQENEPIDLIKSRLMELQQPPTSNRHSNSTKLLPISLDPQLNHLYSCITSEDDVIELQKFIFPTLPTILGNCPLWDTLYTQQIIMRLLLNNHITHITHLRIELFPDLTKGIMFSKPPKLNNERFSILKSLEKITNLQSLEIYIQRDTTPPYIGYYGILFPTTDPMTQCLQSVFDKEWWDGDYNTNDHPFMKIMTSNIATRLLRQFISSSKITPSFTLPQLKSFTLSSTSNSFHPDLTPLTSFASFPSLIHLSLPTIDLGANPIGLQKLVQWVQSMKQLQHFYLHHRFHHTPASLIKTGSRLLDWYTNIESSLLTSNPLDAFTQSPIHAYVTSLDLSFSKGTVEGQVLWDLFLSSHFSRESKLQFLKITGAERYEVYNRWSSTVKGPKAVTTSQAIGLLAQIPNLVNLTGLGLNQLTLGPYDYNDIPLNHGYYYTSIKEKLVIPDHEADLHPIEQLASSDHLKNLTSLSFTKIDSLGQRFIPALSMNDTDTFNNITDLTIVDCEGVSDTLHWLLKTKFLKNLKRLSLSFDCQDDESGDDDDDESGDDDDDDYSDDPDSHEDYYVYVDDSEDHSDIDHQQNEPIISSKLREVPCYRHRLLKQLTHSGVPFSHLPQVPCGSRLSSSCILLTSPLLSNLQSLSIINSPIPQRTIMFLSQTTHFRDNLRHFGIYGSQNNLKFEDENEVEGFISILFNNRRYCSDLSLIVDENEHDYQFIRSVFNRHSYEIGFYDSDDDEDEDDHVNNHLVHNPRPQNPLNNNKVKIYENAACFAPNLTSLELDSSCINNYSLFHLAQSPYLGNIKYLSIRASQEDIDFMYKVAIITSIPSASDAIHAGSRCGFTTKVCILDSIITKFHNNYRQIDDKSGHIYSNPTIKHNSSLHSPLLLSPPASLFSTPRFNRPGSLFGFPTIEYLGLYDDDFTYKEKRGNNNNVLAHIPELSLNLNSIALGHTRNNVDQCYIGKNARLNISMLGRDDDPYIINNNNNNNNNVILNHHNNNINNLNNLHINSQDHEDNLLVHQLDKNSLFYGSVYPDYYHRTKEKDPMLFLPSLSTLLSNITCDTYNHHNHSKHHSSHIDNSIMADLRWRDYCINEDEDRCQSLSFTLPQRRREYIFQILSLILTILAYMFILINLFWFSKPIAFFLFHMIRYIWPHFVAFIDSIKNFL